MLVENEYSDDLKLDKHQLHQNAMDQAALYAKWSSKWAKAELEKNKLEDQLAVIKAKIAKSVREAPESFEWTDNKKPVTETFIKEQITLDVEYQELNNLLTEATYNLNIMKVAEKAFEQRGWALNVLAELYKANYFATNSQEGVFKTETVLKMETAQREQLDKNPRLKRKTP